MTCHNLPQKFIAKRLSFKIIPYSGVISIFYIYVYLTVAYHFRAKDKYVKIELNHLTGPCPIKKPTFKLENENLLPLNHVFIMSLL